MQKLIYTNHNGLSVELGNTQPYILTSFDDGVSLDVQTQKAPFQDGATHIDTLLEPRDLSMVVTIVAPSLLQYEKRVEISSTFNPKVKGKLKYVNDYVSREIDVVVDRPPRFSSGRANLGPNHQRVLINLLAPTPFWMGLMENIVKLEDFVSTFSFPFSFPVSFATRGDLATINNLSDVSTPIEVEFRGLAENPKITNVTTGEFIQINKTIASGESLFINTDFGKKKVEIAVGSQRLNAFSYIDLDSTFFELIPGQNELTFLTDSGTPEVYVKYRNRYVGV